MTPGTSLLVPPPKAPAGTTSATAALNNASISNYDTEPFSFMKAICYSTLLLFLF